MTAQHFALRGRHDPNLELLILVIWVLAGPFFLIGWIADEHKGGINWSGSRKGSGAFNRGSKRGSRCECNTCQPHEKRECGRPEAAGVQNALAVSASRPSGRPGDTRRPAADLHRRRDRLARRARQTGLRRRRQYRTVRLARPPRRPTEQHPHARQSGRTPRADLLLSAGPLVWAFRLQVRRPATRRAS